MTISGRLHTDTPLLAELISEIKKGEIKIPQFQRKFVWKEPQAKNLLDSVSKGYPIGSLLLWKTKDKLAIERNIGEFKLPETDELSPTNYVLDGQQRLTVIYSCLGASIDEGGFSAAYDLAAEVFVSTPLEHDAKVFPLRYMYQTTKMLNFRTGLLSFPDQEKYQSRFDKLIDAFTNYRIPTVLLKDLTLKEVSPIFERINSAGTKLSMYDLMVAATWSKSFNLNVEVENIAQSLQSKNFETIDPDTILKCLTAVQYKSIKKPQITNLRKLSKDDMNKLVEATSVALKKTIDLLSTEFKIQSWDFLPYEATAIIICYIFSKEKHLDARKLKRIRQWFWRSSLSERYRVGGENFVTKDLTDIYNLVVGRSNDATDFGTEPTATKLIDSQFRSNNSRSRAFILALALKNPRNMSNGIAIDVADALSIYNKKQFHHIYPRNHLKEQAALPANSKAKLVEMSNSLVNICMLTASENIKISDEAPQNYIPECLSNLGSASEEVFASNLLPSPKEFDYSTASYEEFLAVRSLTLESYIKQLCDSD